MENNQTVKGSFFGRSSLLSTVSPGVLAAMLVLPLTAPQARAADQASKVGIMASPAMGLQEVVVTARYKKENLQQTPISMSALSGAQIASRGYSNISQISASVPNVTLEAAPAGFGKSVFASIRGIGQTDFKFALEPGVGFYVDDVYYATVFGSIFSLDDISNVEILRGPQGTLFGKNSEGGAIVVNTVKPSANAHSYVELGYGSYNTEELRAAVDATVIPDKLWVRFAGGSLKNDGYVKIIDFACAHPALAGKIKPTTTDAGCQVGTEGGDNVKSFRGSLRWLPTEGVEVNLSADVTDDKGQQAADTEVAINPNALFLRGPNGFNNKVAIPFYGIPYDTRFLTHSPYTTYATFTNPVNGLAVPPENTLYSYGFTGTIDWNTPWDFHIKSISGLRNESGAFTTTYSDSPIALANLYTTLEHRQFSQELQLSGKSFGDSLEWTLGGYYYDGYSHQGGLGDLVEISLEQVPNDPTTDTNKSFFAHGEYHITDALSAEFGARYSMENKNYEYFRYLLAPYHAIPANSFLFPITSKSLSYSHADPKLGLQYQLTPDLMTYVSYSTGYKAGGFNTRPVTAAQATTFLPETLTAYEAGIKSQWFDHRLRANITGFYSQYKNIQLQANGVDANGNLAVLTKNAAQAQIEGMEADTQASLMPGLIVEASASYLQFQYLNLGSAAGVSGGPTLGDVPPLTPKWKFSVGLHYDWDLGDVYGTLTPRIDYAYQSKVYNDAADTAAAAQAGYGVTNLQLAWQSPNGSWSSSFAVNNVMNRFYYLGMYPNISTYGTIEGQPAMPRNYMFKVKRTF